MILLPARTVLLEVQRDDAKWILLWWSRSHFYFFIIPRRVVSKLGWRMWFIWLSLKNFLFFVVPDAPRLRWMLSRWFPVDFSVPSATGNMKFPLLCGVDTSFTLRIRGVEVRYVHLLQFFIVCDHNVSFPDSTRVQCITEKHVWQDFYTKLVHNRLVGDFRPLLRTVLLVRRRAFRTAIFVSDLCGVGVQWLQDNSSKTCQIPRNCKCKWLLVSSSAPVLYLVFLCLLGRFCFTRVWLCPLCCQVLYHHGISMIAPGFTFFTKNSVFRCNQATKTFRSGHDCTSTSSARSPCYFRLQADITIWVLRKMRIYTVLTRTQFHFCSRLHWKFTRWLGRVLTSLLWVSPKLCWSTFHQTNYLWILVANPAIHAMYLFVFLLIHHFYFCFRFLWIQAAGLPEALHSYFHIFLVLDFRCLCWHQIWKLVMKMMEK